MSTAVPSPAYARYIALDVHKHYLVLGGLDAAHNVVLPVRKLDLARFPAWARAHLRPTDAVVLEATTNTWDLYDLIAPLVGRAVVAHAARVGLIAQARVQTDQHAVLTLARLLSADLIPAVWVPPGPVRELRSLLAQRRRLVSMTTQTRNRLHSLLHRHGLTPPAGEVFAPCHRDWWQTLAVSATERLRLRQDLATLDHLTTQVAEIDAELQRLSSVAPWVEQMPYLLQLPGIGLQVALTLLAAIGDITRFPTAKHLVGYSGLGASVHDSGETHRTGHITKQGRKDLRWALVQAAWTAVNHDPHWRAQFERLAARLGKPKAIVAIARKLLVVVWQVLTQRAADRHADPDRVARKFMVWSDSLTPDQRGGLTGAQFVRYHLLRLGLGDELTHITRGQQRRPLAPVADVLALRPELRPAA